MIRSVIVLCIQLTIFLRKTSAGIPPYPPTGVFPLDPTAGLPSPDSLFLHIPGTFFYATVQAFCTIEI